MIAENKERLTITLSKNKIRSLKLTAIEKNITVSELLSIMIYAYYNFEEIKNEVNRGIEITKKLNS